MGGGFNVIGKEGETGKDLMDKVKLRRIGSFFPVITWEAAGG